MKLTSRTEYALLALIFLARQKQATLVTGDAISESQNIPKQFLQQILRTLRQSQYIKAYKGQNGGYRLARAAEKISIAEIIRLFDGALAPTVCVSKFFYEKTPLEKEKKLVKMFREIRDYVAKKLESATLADML